MKTLLIIFLVIFPMTALAQDFKLPTTQTFTAKVSNVRLSADLVEKGRKMDDVVSVQASTIIFPHPLNIPDVRKAKSYGEPAVDTFVGYIKVCMDGTAQDLAKFWIESERNEQLSLFSEAGVLKSTHEQFREHPGVTIVGLIFRGNETTVLTRGVFVEPEYVLGVTLAKVGGNTFLTNKNKDDLELAIIEASFLPAQK